MHKRKELYRNEAIFNYMASKGEFNLPPESEDLPFQYKLVLYQDELYKTLDASDKVIPVLQRILDLLSGLRYVDYKFISSGIRPEDAVPPLRHSTVLEKQKVEAAWWVCSKLEELLKLQETSDQLYVEDMEVLNDILDYEVEYEEEQYFVFEKIYPTINAHPVADLLSRVPSPQGLNTNMVIHIETIMGKITEELFLGAIVGPAIAQASLITWVKRDKFYDKWSTEILKMTVPV
jgi:hypothetical protein